VGIFCFKDVAKVHRLRYILHNLNSDRSILSLFLGLCFCSVALLNCRDVQKLNLESGENDLIISAVVTPGGAITQLSKRLAHQNSQVFRYDKSRALVTWVIRQNQLITAEGETLSEEQIEALTIRTRNSPSPDGSCKKCTAPSSGGPQLFHPGDACVIPEIAEGIIKTESDDFSDNLKKLRESIVIDFPGNCDCAAKPIGLAAPLKYRVFHPHGDPWPYSDFSVSQSGIVGTFSETYAEIRHPDGQVFQRYAEDLPFLGPVISVTSVSDGFLVLAQYPSLTHLYDIFHVHWDLSQIRTVWSSEVPRQLVEDIFQGPLENQVLLQIEGRLDYKPDLFDCRRQTDLTYQCRSAFNEDARALANQKITHVTKHSDGRIIILYRDGAFLTGQLESDQWVWALHNGPSTAQDGDTVYQFTRGSQIEEYDGRWILCGDVENPITQKRKTGVFAGTVTASGAQWTFLHLDKQDCKGIMPKLDNPETLQVMMSHNQVWELDAQNNWKEADRPLSQQEGIDRPIFQILKDQHGEINFLGPDQSLFSRKTATSSAVQFYGSDHYTPYNYHAMIPFEDHVLALRSDGQTAKISKNKASIEYGQMDGLLVGESIIDARLSSYDASILITSNGEHARILRLNPETMVATEVFRDEKIPNMDREFTEIVDTPNGNIVVATSIGELLHIKKAKAQTISIEWDDPQTNTVESAPENFRVCYHDGEPYGGSVRTRPTAGLWQSLEESRGVVWASGCEGVFLRIIPTDDHVSVRRIFLDIEAEASFGLFEDFPALTAVRSTCGNQVLVGSRGQHNVNHYTGRVWKLEMKPTDADFQYTELKLLPEYQTIASGVERTYDYDAGFPVSLLGPNSYFRQVFSSSTNNTSTIGDLSGTSWFRLEAKATAAAQIANDLIVVGANHGRIVVGRP